MMRRTSWKLWPATAWNTALCSESTGRMVAPEARQASLTKSPAATRDSLLARAMIFPVWAAARVEGNPAAPDWAESTSRASGSAAMAA